MIIFTSNTNIIQFINSPIVYNLSSFYSGYENITNLITKIPAFNNTSIPVNEFIYSPEFDNMYANSLLNNAVLFNDFIKIVINACSSNNVIVLIAHDDYRDAITESIIKLIQIRYGYNCWEVEGIEDVECLRESFFTPYGLLALDEDKKKYDELYNNGYARPLNNLKDTEY